MPKATAGFYRSNDIKVFSSAPEVAIAEEELIDGEDNRRVLSTRKVPLRGPAGDVTHLIGIISDITHLKAVEKDLRLSTEMLERRVAERTNALALAQEDLVRKERLAILGRLAGGVAHQIRNPLGITDLLDYARVRVPVRRPTSIADVIEAMPAGGTLTIEAALRDTPRGSFEVTVPGTR